MPFHTNNSTCPACGPIHSASRRARRASRTSRARCVPARTCASFVDSLPTSSRPPTSRPSSRAIVDAKRATAASSGASARTSSRPGLGPVLIDLMERGFVSAIATNGAAIIHDFEIALAGATSEDVDESLGPGRFGMAEETGRLLNEAITDGVGARPGHRPGGRRVSARHGSRRSRAAAFWRAAARLQHSSHRARGRSAPTSFTCTRPRQAPRSGKAASAISGTSRRTSRGSSGGVYLNCGSAVMLPEVFLKAVALVAESRHRAGRIDDGESRFRPHVSAADQRRHEAHGRNGPRVSRSSVITRS